MKIPPDPPDTILARADAHSRKVDIYVSKYSSLETSTEQSDFDASMLGHLLDFIDERTLANIAEGVARDCYNARLIRDQSAFTDALLAAGENLLSAQRKKT